MTPPKIDLVKLCPELAEALNFWYPDDLNTDVREIAKRRMELIAATMLKLAEENEIRQEIIEGQQLLITGHKFNNRNQIDVAEDLVKIGLDKLIELAARKGDPHE